jgi:hypothetical protein
MDESQYLHQIPLEMWVMYVEGRRETIETICGEELKPEIPLNQKKPRCRKCWPLRERLRPQEPLLAKKFKTKAVIIEAIQVTPDQIDKVLTWGDQNSVKMAWLGADRGLHVDIPDGRTLRVPTYDFLVKDLIGNITNLPSWLFWTMYEEE